MSPRAIDGAVVVDEFTVENQELFVTGVLVGL
jgi:hypothetical protein